MTLGQKAYESWSNRLVFRPMAWQLDDTTRAAWQFSAERVIETWLEANHVLGAIETIVAALPADSQRKLKG